MKGLSSSPDAIATIKGIKEFPNLFGEVKFFQKKNYVYIEATIKGLPTTGAGFFGFHIHEGASCTGTNLSDTKGHYNPENSYHPNHAGDLPPLLFCNGGAYQTVATDRFKLKHIIGKTIVIHSMPDDFTSQPSGNSGEKIACGAIHSNHSCLSCR
jgi:Cu-Zn family superoxide dismutase